MDDYGYGYRIEPYRRFDRSPVGVLLALVVGVLLLVVMTGAGSGGSSPPPSSGPTYPSQRPLSTVAPSAQMLVDSAQLDALHQRVQALQAALQTAEQRADQSNAAQRALQLQLQQALDQAGRTPQLEEALRAATDREAQAGAAARSAAQAATQRVETLQRQLSRAQTDVATSQTELAKSAANNAALQAKIVELEAKLNTPSVPVQDLIDYAVVFFLVGVAVCGVAVRRLNARHSHDVAALQAERNQALGNEMRAVDRLSRSRAMYHDALKEAQKQLHTARDRTRAETRTPASVGGESSRKSADATISMPRAQGQASTGEAKHTASTHDPTVTVESSHAKQR